MRFLLVVIQVAGFACLCCGVIGINCIAAPSLALLSEAAAGPGLVVALPMYNSSESHTHIHTHTALVASQASTPDSRAVNDLWALGSCCGH